MQMVHSHHPVVRRLERTERTLSVVVVFVPGAGPSPLRDLMGARRWAEARGRDAAMKEAFGAIEGCLGRPGLEGVPLVVRATATGATVVGWLCEDDLPPGLGFGFNLGEALERLRGPR